MKSKDTSLVKQILSEYYLCDNCTGRLLAERSSKSGKKTLTKCFVCKNIFTDLHFHVDKLKEISSPYKFSSFLIGIIIKSSFVERDDSIKSKYQLKGIDSIKASITNEISKSFAKKTKTKPDIVSPDIVLTINLKDNSYELRAKTIFLCGRYKKNTRDVVQKQRSCSNCNGKGCKQCDNHGISEFNSIEGYLAKHIFAKFKAEKIKVTWIGGEEKNSMVKGTGRPFFVQIINPKIRHVRLQNLTFNKITFKNFKIIQKIPPEPISFCSKVNLLVDTEHKILEKSLKSLGKLKQSSISINDNFGNIIKKNIYDIKYTKKSPNSFSLTLVVEGGFPIKKFIDSRDVEPKLNDLLDNRLVCKEFDFLDIVL